MESLTYLKNIRISPKKMRFMLPAVKKMKPAEALDYLMYAPEKTAKIYYKAIQSAISNAKNTLKVSPDVLQFKLLTIEEGMALQRYVAGSRGTAKPIRRRFSHIKIILTPQVEAKKKVTKKAQSDEPVKVEKNEVEPVEKKEVKKTVRKATKKAEK